MLGELLTHTEYVYFNILCPHNTIQGRAEDWFFFGRYFFFAREDFLTTPQVNSLPPHLFSHFTWGGKEFTWGRELREEVISIKNIFFYDSKTTPLHDPIFLKANPSIP